MTEHDMGLSEARRRERRINRRSNLMIMLGMTLFIGLSWLILQQVYDPEQDLLERLHGTTPLRLSLEVLKETERGVEPLRDAPHPGDVLRFRVSSSQPLHAAMAVSVNGGPPGVVFDHTRIPPGRQRPVQHWDDPFRYRVSGADRRLRFCLLHQPDARQLQAEIDDLARFWPELKTSDCIQLQPTG